MCAYASGRAGELVGGLLEGSRDNGKVFQRVGEAVEESNPVASGEDLGVGEDTCAEEARDRGNIPLPRFACRGTLGDKSDGEHGEAELRVQGHEA